MIRIIIADDHKLVREAWSMLLSRDKRLNIIAICENGQEVIDYIGENEADIILMDINMEPVNGIEATRTIRKFNQQIKIIGISVHTDLPYVKALMESGANGYVTKNSSGAEMINAIFEVMDGNVFYCKEIASIQKSPD
jgi:two-component system, NarL family, invasion response regulator UvrY